MSDTRTKITVRYPLVAEITDGRIGSLLMPTTGEVQAVYDQRQDDPKDARIAELEGEVERLRGELRAGNCHDHIGSAVTEIDAFLDSYAVSDEPDIGGLEQLSEVLLAAYNESGDQPSVRDNAPARAILDGEGGDDGKGDPECPVCVGANSGCWLCGPYVARGKAIDALGTILDGSDTNKGGDHE